MLLSFSLFPNQQAESLVYRRRYRILFPQTLPKANCRTLSDNQGLGAAQYPQDHNLRPAQARAAIWLFQSRPDQYPRHKYSFVWFRASVRILSFAELNDDPELFAKISGALRSY